MEGGAYTPAEARRAPNTLLTESELAARIPDALDTDSEDFIEGQDLGSSASPHKDSRKSTLSDRKKGKKGKKVIVLGNEVIKKYGDDKKDPDSDDDAGGDGGDAGLGKQVDKAMQTFDKLENLEMDNKWVILILYPIKPMQQYL